MTVPPLFGWESILLVVLLVAAVAVVFLVASALGTGADHRAEWRAGLTARSRERTEPPADLPEGPVGV
jgi:cytochrome oxidase assembly protein ShyY1